MKKFLITLVFLLAFCQSALAHIVYTTSDGSMGFIRISGLSSVDVRPSLRTGSDLFVGSFWNGSATQIILLDRKHDATDSGDRAFIFNPRNIVNGTIEPNNDNEIFLEGAFDTVAIDSAPNGRSFFVASNGNASIVEFRTDENITSRDSYLFVSSDDISDEVHAKKVIVNGNYIYALFGIGDSKSAVLHFDGTLKENSSFGSFDVNFDANDMEIFGKSRIAIAHQNGFNVYHGRTQNLSEDSYSNVQSLCSDGGNGLFFISRNSDGDSVVHWNGSNEFNNLYSGQTGDAAGLVYDKDQKILAAIIGNEIVLLDASTLTSNSIQTVRFDRAQLGGNPSNMALTTITDTDDDSSSSSCNFGLNLWHGLLLLSLTVMLERLFHVCKRS